MYWYHILVHDEVDARVFAFCVSPPRPHIFPVAGTAVPLAGSGTFGKVETDHPAAVADGIALTFASGWAYAGSD